MGTQAAVLLSGKILIEILVELIDKMVGGVSHTRHHRGVRATIPVCTPAMRTGPGGAGYHYEIAVRDGAYTGNRLVRDGKPADCGDIIGFVHQRKDDTGILSELLREPPPQIGESSRRNIGRSDQLTLIASIIMRIEDDDHILVPHGHHHILQPLQLIRGKVAEKRRLKTLPKEGKPDGVETLCSEVIDRFARWIDVIFPEFPRQHAELGSRKVYATKATSHCCGNTLSRLPSQQQCNHGCPP